MAKKNLNPADAYRKTQRKKELKKNKEQRQKNRDFALVKKDTSELDSELATLEAKAEQTKEDKERITELKTELENIQKKKDEYVAEHPEHRHLVFRRRKAKDGEEEPDKPKGPQTRNVFNKYGIPRHPERSIYYDPVYNPYGVPPPGMPYMERPLRPDEVASDQENSEGDSDDDIIMPEGPPPGANESDVDSDDDIPMPEGLPPAEPGEGEINDASASNILLRSIGPPLPPGPPPFRSQAFPLHSNGTLPFPPPPPPGSVPGHPVGFLPPPTPFVGFPQMPFSPPPPPGFTIPPPPAGFPVHQGLPPPPPGFFPRQQSKGSMQDPLSSIPHQTFQGHRATRATMPPPPPTSGLPPKPAAEVSAAATVSAAPELRDLKKESTAFVPTALKRKKAGVGPAGPSKINAAPSVAGGESEKGRARPDLMSTLRGTLGEGKAHAGKSKVQPKGKDDYAKFMEELGDIL
ncbi:hypothetical protein NEOLEDRAFT_1153365 [Neolentinus lepideus HHB14362 ss-1]|uniref:Wbp11/ELF5/Saf1 N-terminal domain-containing protein n=1 Tax=Neolentinus lepideus HHB14362 ss-1 TaxID=1314782 RepID=A0A165WBH5_9AGAM|nr:hypothetical protein NEOLEDRAFT_1153365 [Neolentinus lepideus HHB14362 ss-1]